MANDIFSTLRVYLSKMTDGERTPAEILNGLNAWLRESGESIKAKIEEEVERAVAKRGFVKQADFDALKKEVADLKAGAPRKSAAKKATIKSPKKAAKPKTAKKTTAKKSTVKKAAKK